MTRSLITLGQEKQVARFFEDALNKANLDKNSIQRLIENGDKFQKDILTSIKKYSISNQYANEEVSSDYGYLSGYRKPKYITTQTNILRQLFPGIGYADEEIAEQTFPKNAEGWFAIPRWQSVAKTYNKAVEKVLEVLKQRYKGQFYNWCESRLSPEYLRQNEHTKSMFRTIGRQQKGYDILVVAAQFGFLHRGKSVRRAREVFSSNEFGLDTFSIGIMLLTHLEERLQNYNDLWIDCAGDEYSSEGDGDFDEAPCFCFDDGKLELGTFYVSDPFDDFGSASAFLRSEK